MAYKRVSLASAKYSGKFNLTELDINFLWTESFHNIEIQHSSQEATDREIILGILKSLDFNLSRINDSLEFWEIISNPNSEKEEFISLNKKKNRLSAIRDKVAQSLREPLDKLLRKKEDTKKRVKI